MPAAELPPDEPQRLGSLHKMFVLDTPAEERFDRLTRLGRRLLRAPFCMLSLIDEDRQWFKSAQGHLFVETPRSDSICSFTILEEGALVVPDASVDARFFDHSVVAGAPGVRFYAGFPITNQDGFAVGTFCVLDTEPREIDEDDLASLQDLAACAASEFQLLRTSQSEQELLREMDQARSRAAVDGVTRCWNQPSILALFEKERRTGALSLMVLHLDGLRAINETWGEVAGDGILRQVAERVRGQLRPEDLLGRLTGSSFLVVTRCPLAHIEGYAQSLLDSLVQTPLQVQQQKVSLLATVGVAPVRGGPDASLDVLERASKAGRSARQPGKSDVVVAV